jgi:hypothetical protein
MLTPHSFGEPRPATARENLTSGLIVAAAWVLIGGLVAAWWIAELPAEIRARVGGRT